MCRATTSSITAGTSTGRTHHQSFENAGPFSNQTFRFGGARTRVFGSEVDYLVTKTPLVRYEPDVVLAGGQHWTSHPSERIAHDGCAVLHFKYFSSLVDRATAEAERAERSHWRQQIETYRATLERERELRSTTRLNRSRSRAAHSSWSSESSTKPGAAAGRVHPCPGLRPERCSRPVPRGRRGR